MCDGYQASETLRIVSDGSLELICCKMETVVFTGKGELTIRESEIGHLEVTGDGLDVNVHNSSASMNLNGSFGTLRIDGEKTVVRELMVGRNSVSSVDVFDLEDAEASTVRLECCTRIVDVLNCVIHGFRIKNSVGERLAVNDCLLFNITEVDKCRYGECQFLNDSFAYTRINGEFGRIDMTCSRFTMLMDLRGASVSGLIDLTDTILVESMKLPSPENYGGRIRLDSMVIKGAVDIVVPRNGPDAKAFFDSLCECNSQEGLKVARVILEDNCLYKMADESFIAQRKKDIDDKSKPLKYRMLHALSFALGGNGMRPSFILVWMIALILAFSLMYAALGMDTSLIEGGGYTGNLLLSLSSFFLYDITGGGGTAQMYLCISEGIMGMLLMLYFALTLTRKLIRRS